MLSSYRYYLNTNTAKNINGEVLKDVKDLTPINTGIIEVETVENQIHTNAGQKENTFWPF